MRRRWVALLAAVVTLASGCGRRSRAQGLSPAPLFVDVATKLGIDFRHTNGARADLWMIEIGGSGCAFIDYDNDGYVDLLLLDSGPLPGGKGAAHNRLYHNERGQRFADVTAGSGLEHTGYAQGVAVGDYDNDGFPDVFITGVGGNRLLHNEGGTGTFRDVTGRAGVGDRDHGARYATSAAFGDFDGDGNLDLYVCHYCHWSPQTNRVCKNARGEKDYCSPDIYDADPDRLYRNRGDGTFEDVTRKAGLDRVAGRGFAVAWLDYDGDGHEDLYVANDLNPGFLWRNRGDGTFEEGAVRAGCAFADSGALLSGMGIGLGDYDNDGREDLFISNFSGRPNTLYRNLGSGRFADTSVAAGVALPHMPFLSFGCEFFDYDADGWKDLVVANGHVQLRVASTFEGVTYAERKQLFHNERNGKFHEVIRELGDLAHATVGRGLAVGDFDNDGRLDVLVNNQNGKAELFHNRVATGNHWVSFKTIGVKSNRDGYHAKVTVTAGGRRQYSEVRSGSSYASHSDSRVYFGLGSAAVVQQVEIRWPSRTRDLLKDVRADRLYVVKEGAGIVGEQPGSAR